VSHTCFLCESGQKEVVKKPTVAGKVVLKATGVVLRTVESATQFVTLLKLVD